MATVNGCSAGGRGHRKTARARSALVPRRLAAAWVPAESRPAAPASRSAEAVPIVVVPVVERLARTVKEAVDESVTGAMLRLLSFCSVSRPGPLIPTTPRIDEAPNLIG